MRHSSALLAVSGPRLSNESLALSYSLAAFHGFPTKPACLPEPWLRIGVSCDGLFEWFRSIWYAALTPDKAIVTSLGLVTPRFVS